MVGHLANVDFWECVNDLHEHRTNTPKRVHLEETRLFRVAVDMKSIDGEDVVSTLPRLCCSIDESSHYHTSDVKGRCKGDDRVTSTKRCAKILVKDPKQYREQVGRERMCGGAALAYFPVCVHASLL